jgi:hypothetical protein
MELDWDFRYELLSLQDIMEEREMELDWDFR